MCDYMINSNKCKRSPISGYGTIENQVGDMVAYLCRQHKGMYINNMLDMTKVIWTNKVTPVIADTINNQGEQLTMDTITITTIAQFAENGKNRVKCVKCSTRETSVYHHINDIRSCLGAMPPADVATHTKFNIPANVHFKVWNGERGQQMVSEWHKNRHLANLRLIELKKGSIKPANNKHGFWLHYPAV
jgi:hypothetical protein